MQTEDYYRAALIALRDSQWEEAARNLLTIAFKDPAYRDIDRVLKVLERTRGTSYWSAAFEVAQQQNDQAAAQAALDQLATINPDYPQLDSMRTSLGQTTPDTTSDPFAGLFDDSESSFEADPFETWSLLPEPSDEDEVAVLPHLPEQSNEYPTPAQREGTDPIRKLDLDPLTELLMNDDWIADTNSPVQSSETDAVAEKSPVPGGDDMTGIQVENAAPASESKTAPKVITPLSLPTEPEGEFVRLEPTVIPEEKEPSMATEQLDSTDVQDAPVSAPEIAPRQYSFAQVLGLFTFPLILLVVVVYVLFGQGGPTLADMLASAQSTSAINSATDLVAAVDDVLLQNNVNNETLEQLGTITEVIAEEAPELQTALDGWIETAVTLITTRENWQLACTDESSDDCTSASTALTAAEEAAQQARAAACALMDCPNLAQNTSQG